MKVFYNLGIDHWGKMPIVETDFHLWLVENYPNGHVHNTQTIMEWLKTQGFNPEIHKLTRKEVDLLTTVINFYGLTFHKKRT